MAVPRYHRRSKFICGGCAAFPVEGYIIVAPRAIERSLLLSEFIALTTVLDLLTYYVGSQKSLSTTSYLLLKREHRIYITALTPIIIISENNLDETRITSACRT